MSIESSSPPSSGIGLSQQLDHYTGIRSDPASAPRRSQALAALCNELTDTQTRYPGTNLVMAYSVKDHPQRA